MAKPAKQRQFCPICNTEMGQVMECHKPRYFCGECGISTNEKGELLATDEEGEMNKVGYEQTRAESEDDKPVNYAVYFTSKDKFTIKGVIGMETKNGWAKMVKENGKEVLLMGANINLIEQL